MLHFELTLVERRLDYQEKNGIRHKKAKETINKGGNIYITQKVNFIKVKKISNNKILIFI